MSKFTIGQKLSARSTCDHECVFTGTVIKRTAKTVTIETAMNGVKRCKIYDYGDGEFILPFGNYSMAPVFEA